MPESARFDELGIPVLQGGEDVKCNIYIWRCLMGYCVCGENKSKEWRYFEFEQCPWCGNDVEVLTDAPAGYVQDGDAVRCVDANCGFRSCVSVDDDEIWIQDA
jgi:hypothetical protein